MTRVIDALGRIEATLGAESQRTDFGYDGNGSLTTVVDPLSHLTQHRYDRLSRLDQTLDPFDDSTEGKAGRGRLTGLQDGASETRLRLRESASAFHLSYMNDWPSPLKGRGRASTPGCKKPLLSVWQLDA